MIQHLLCQVLISAAHPKDKQAKRDCPHNAGRASGSEQRVSGMAPMCAWVRARRRNDGLMRFRLTRNHDLLGLRSLKRRPPGNQAQRLVHLAGGLKALGGVEAQRPINHVFQPDRESRVHCAHRLEAKRERWWYVPRHHLVQQHAQREDVAARVGAPATLVLFWRGVARRAQRQRVAGRISEAASGKAALPGRRIALAGRGTRNAKIHHDGAAIRRQDDVGGLQVAKDNRRLLAVEVGEYVTKLARVIERFIQWQRSAFARIAAHFQASGERGPLDVIHDEVAGGLVGEVIKDTRDIRMTQRGEQPGLAAKTTNRPLALFGRGMFGR